MSVTKFQTVTDRRFSYFKETDTEERNANALSLTSYIIYVVANHATYEGFPESI
jgi:hypothetical protein